MVESSGVVPGSREGCGKCDGRDDEWLLSPGRRHAAQLPCSQGRDHDNQCCKQVTADPHDADKDRKANGCGYYAREQGSARTQTTGPCESGLKTAELASPAAEGVERLLDLPFVKVRP